MGNISHNTGNVGIGNALASTIPGVLTVTDTTNTTKAAFGRNAANSLNFIQGGGDYMAIGYNLLHTGTNNTWNYAGTGNDFASLLRWQQGGFQFWGTSTQGAAPTAASLTNFLSIKNSGNVGIGTDDPTVKLDVNGGVKVSGTLQIGSASMSVPSGTAPLFGARAFVTFNAFRDTSNAVSPAATNRKILHSGNVASVKKEVAGHESAYNRYRVTFTTPMPNADYAVVGTCSKFSAGNGTANVITYAVATNAAEFAENPPINKTTDYFEVQVVNSATQRVDGYDLAHISLVVFG